MTETMSPHTSTFPLAARRSRALGTYTAAVAVRPDGTDNTETIPLDDLATVTWHYLRCADGHVVTMAAPRWCARGTELRSHDQVVRLVRHGVEIDALGGWLGATA